MTILRKNRFDDYHPIENEPKDQKRYSRIARIDGGKWEVARLKETRTPGKGRKHQYYLVYSGRVDGTDKEGVCVPEPPFGGNDDAFG